MTPASHDRERLLEHEGAPTDAYNEPRHSLDRPWKRNFPWILNVILGLATVVLAVQFSRGDRYQHTGDVNGIAPRFAQRIVTFQPSKEATASIGDPNQKDATDAFWRTFAPDNFGLVNLPDYKPDRYPNLAPPTVEAGGYNLVDTSVAHQLHCLHSIMEAYNDLAANNTSMHMAKRAPKHHDHSWHLGHCFDYIRQGIMCCGDTALEGAATTFPHGLKGSDGWNAKHVCKDYGQVTEWILSMGPE